MNPGRSYRILLGLLLLAQSAAAALTIRSNGRDMSDSLLCAIARYDTVVLDGAAGDFIVGHTIVLRHMRHKTLMGINKACLRTRFCLTNEIRVMLDSADVPAYSTAGDGGVLSNGQKVHEERERVTRQLLIDRFQDDHESFRSSGCIQVSHCRNITIRGLRLQGPGAVDVSGNDLLGIDHSMYITVDSCVLMDGMDGNLDITSQSDSIIISHCYFGYSEMSYDHMNSNLVGAADRVEADRGKLHVTYAYCTWGEGCRQRMPMVRFGTIYLDHCRWECHTPHPVIDVRREATVIIEGASFGKGVQIPYRACESSRVEWR